MAVFRFAIAFLHPDPRSAAYRADAHALGFAHLAAVECQDLYFVEGDLTDDDLQRLATALLADPVTQQARWTQLPTHEPAPAGQQVVEVALRPGVTDPVAHEIVRAAVELGVPGVHRAATGLRFLLAGIDATDAARLATRLLANAVIHHWTLGEIAPAFPLEAAATDQTEVIPLRGLDDAALLALSQARRAALDLAEMQAIQRYCAREGRDLTDVEFETIAQTWSEHCVHKTFKALITVDREGEAPAVVDSIYRTYIRRATEEIAAPWVLSAFVDNAGIIDLDGVNEVSFKVETHNHPSAIEPFGGANTGVGGVIRDVLGVSHKPFAATDVLCFGPQHAALADLPEGVLHPRVIMSGVVAGVQDYGNKIGIPTVSGAILFDAGYTANPLVFCGAAGIAPQGMRPHGVQPGDRVIVLGGRTGRDGLRGATFSSMTMDAQTGEVAGSSVQIGDPITEKGLIDVVVRARDERLYHAITDCGAGGLSSAVGEMASTLGAEVDLTRVRLKYPGLAPWEIWLSEAQERMVLAAPPAALPRLQQLCDTFDTELTDIGHFTGAGRLVVRYGAKTVLDLDNDFLHDGIPQRRLHATIARRTWTPAQDAPANLDPARTLLALLAHPNIASKAPVIRSYDHEVQGGTAVKPLTGVQDDGPSDAAVIRPLGAVGRAGVAIGAGVNPAYGKLDPHAMALCVIDEAIRNVVAVGADPARVAILDNFCWGDPRRPSTLGELVEAARGCYDGALRFRTPFISGKDSLNNEYLGADGQRHAIPPTLLISAIGVMADVSAAVTMDLKTAGNLLYLVGDFQPTLGGAHWSLVTGVETGEGPPALSDRTPALYAGLHQAIAGGLVRACHDLSEGGLAVAAAEMCIAGRLGLTVELWGEGRGAKGDHLLFGESNGCLLVEVKPGDSQFFELTLGGLPVQRLGRVTAEPVLTILHDGAQTLSCPVADLVAAWHTPLQ